MSTKIYYGVRFPKTKLAEFAAEAHVRGLRSVERVARKFLANVRDDDPELTQPKDDDPKQLRHRKISYTIRHINELSGHPYCMDYSISWRVWVPMSSRYALAVPCWNGLTQHKMPRWVESYGYWDNTDKPNSISDREWNRRKRAWAPACEPSYANHKFMLDVFDARDKYSLSMSWLLLRLTGAPQLRPQYPAEMCRGKTSRSKSP